MPQSFGLTGHYRYRAIPSFGRDTIRKFSANASAMRRKAARDYEDLLQVRTTASPLLRERNKLTGFTVFDPGF